MEKWLRSCCGKTNLAQIMWFLTNTTRTLRKVGETILVYYISITGNFGFNQTVARPYGPIFDGENLTFTFDEKLLRLSYKIFKILWRVGSIKSLLKESLVALQHQLRR